MSIEWVSIIQAITSVLAVAVALLAVIIAIRAEVRANKRFDAQIALQRKVAAANVRPILAIFTSEFVDNKGIVLSNAGIGTAVITSIVFIKGNQEVQSMPLLFNLPANVLWDNYWTFSSQKHYLIAGKSIDLIRLSASNLSRQGFSETEIANILNAWQEQVSGITIKITYEDVLGNKQENYERTLD